MTSSAGNDSLHGGHQLAQKSTSTTLPFASAIRTTAPAPARPLFLASTVAMTAQTISIQNRLDVWNVGELFGCNRAGAEGKSGIAAISGPVPFDAADHHDRNQRGARHENEKFRCTC